MPRPLVARPKRAQRLVLALSLAAGTLAAAPGTATAEESHPSVNGTFTLIGRGYGHGRGMSQWGSYEQAKEGRSWQQILGFYYPGLSVTTASASTIRVGTQGRTGATVRVAAEPGLTATDGAGQNLTLPTTDGTDPVLSWEVAPPATGGTASTTVLWMRTATARKAFATSESGHWSLAAADGSLRAQRSSGATAATYLGTFTGVRSGSGVQPVLTTTLEDYVRQVVPWESIASWPVQALAAQAVAARSYAAWYVAHPRTSLYDICDTTSCQVFGGITQESTQSRQGVEATAGQVLVTSAGAVARTEFSSSNGGEVAPTSSTWSVPKADPYEMRLPLSVTTWTATTTAARLQAAWPQVGTVQRLVVVSRDGYGQWGGRVTSLRVEGSQGSVTISPSQLSGLVTGWKGAWFTIVDGPDAITHDWSGDGRPEVLARDAAGALYAQEFAASPGLSAAAAGGAHRIAAGWSGYRAVFSGQFTADRMADVLAVDTAGRLRLFASRGGSFAPSIVVATGMSGYTDFTLAPTLNHGRPMLLARRTSDGALVGFAADGRGGLSSTPVVLTPSGWGRDVTAMVAVRSVVGDGSNDVVVRRSSGQLQAFPGTSSGRFGAPVVIGSGWNAFASITSPGDVNADGRSDLVARAADGTTRLYLSLPGAGFTSRVLPSSTGTLLP